MVERGWHRTIAIVAAVGMLATGCKSKKATANNENFTKALNAYFYTHDDCLYPHALKFPYELSSTGKAEVSPKALDALTDAGLLTRDEDRSIKVKRYALKPLGTKATARFCYGHREVTNVESFTPPANTDGHFMSTVNYSYAMKDVPEWAKDGAVQHAFPEMEKAVNGQGQGKTDVMLAFNGWEVPQ